MLLLYSYLAAAEVAINLKLPLMNGQLQGFQSLDEDITKFSTPKKEGKLKILEFS